MAFKFFLKGAPVVEIGDVNDIKVVKNGIYNRVTEVFVYNLKKLIALEGTQKQLARKIGISEDLLSKYKSGDAFPAIETLIYISEVYKISLEALIGVRFDSELMERLELYQQPVVGKLFESRYYAYFFVTNVGNALGGRGIHEGVIEVDEHLRSARFMIYADERVVKGFSGTMRVSDRLVYFNMSSGTEGDVTLHLVRPNLNKNSYVGGMALMLLPSDARSKPCCQKVLLSKVRIDREVHSEALKALLLLEGASVGASVGDGDGAQCGHIKVSPSDDERAYSFVRQQLV